MAKVAFQEIDIETHSGTHPRLGVVDHICFHSLGDDHVAATAKSLAADVGSKLQVPTFLYGAVHHEGRSLDSIRRELGYFKPNSTMNEWTGWPRSESLLLTPDEAPPRALQRKGVLVIGATQWVDTKTSHFSLMTLSQFIIHKISKSVSGRGHGLTSVQSMELAHGDDVIEVACNLVEPTRTGGNEVQLHVKRLAREEQVEMGKGYYIDLSQDKLVENISSLIRAANDAKAKVD